jgi:hypothetical protein
VLEERDRPRQALLGRGDDQVHDPHRVDGPFAHRCLGRQHQRVGPVEDRICHIRDLGSRRPAGGGHGLEHLRGHDDGLGLFAGGLDGPLLHERNLFKWELDAEIATSDHQPVEGGEDVVQLGDGLGLLQLGKHWDARSHSFHDRAHCVDI